MNRLIAAASLTPVISQIAADVAQSASPFRRALIVGGTKGIGRGIAHALARKDGTTIVEIVGRDETAAKAVIAELREIRETTGISNPSPDHSDVDPYKFWQIDLSTLHGCDDLVSRLGAENATPYDLLVFTVGAWPEFGKPLTSEGFPRVAFLDVLTRFRILSKMVESRLLAGDNPMVLSVLASSQTNSIVASQTLSERKEFLLDGVLKKRNCEEAIKYRQPKNFTVTLQTAGCAHDVMLCAAARKYSANNLRIVGTFPGLVDTGVSAALLGNTVASVANYFATWVPGGMVSTDVSGDQHVAVVDEVWRRAVSGGENAEGEHETVATTDKAVTFWNASLGREHEIPGYVFEDQLGDWFMAELEKL